ncbi:hypothetical protein AJ80_04399 [Polytolypa hystricis UAMH7299]|uniref:RRM domain-containing protein n=1 Tax=Polytolypa hystricis (strain UAMH7299) TaxID=1447883 RepID=A0A2B7YCQ7_POLH7|nr:hypothetical protein AJ80_04399 [Polytolypa hystricis UAMH7299]
MLKPFCVRDLLDPPSTYEHQPGDPSNGDVGPTRLSVDKGYDNETVRYRRPDGTVFPFPVLENRDGVVQVSADEYDRTISENPEATLTYVDEEDERVTVGSSMELAQRLDEPVQLPYSLSNPTYQHSDDTHELSRMHIFDIQRTNSALNTWRTFEKRTTAELNALNRGPSSLAQSPKEDLLQGELDNDINDSGICVFVGSMKLLAQEEDEDPRDHWFRLCNPPLASSDPAPASEDAQTEPRSSGQSVLRILPPQGTDDDAILAEKGADNDAWRSRTSSSITEEGKRQAREAGAKIRASRDLWFHSSPSNLSIPVASENSWSSYSNIPSAFTSERPPTQREPKSRESPILQEAQPLLTAFEEELSRLMDKELVNASSVASAEAEPKAEATEAELKAEATEAESKAEAAEAAEANASPEPRPLQTEESNTSSQSAPKPVELFEQTMNSLFRGVGLLTSELRSKLPEVERRVLDAHQHLPTHVEANISGTINAIGAHIQTLANSVQDAAVSTRTAADRVREAELRDAGQAVDNLQNLATDLGEMGRTLFSTFQARASSAETRIDETIEGNQTSQPNAENNQPSNPLSNSLDGLAELPARSNSTSPHDHVADRRKDDENSTPSPHNVTTGGVMDDTLFIGNIAPNITETTISSAVAKWGFICQIWMPKDPLTGENSGFCYAHFPSKYAASGALKAMQGSCIDGQSINIELSSGPSFEELKSSNQNNPPGSEQRVLNCQSNPAPASRLYSHHRRKMVDPSLRPSQPTVAFNAPDNSPNNSTHLRRAKSVGTLSQPAADVNQCSQTNQPAETSPHNGLSGTLLDHEDVDPVVATLYPSLAPVGSRDPSVAGMAPSRTLSPSLEMARFPTIAQLEASAGPRRGLQPRTDHGSAIPANMPSQPHVSSSLRTSHQPSTGITSLPGAWPSEMQETRRNGSFIHSYTHPGQPNSAPYNLRNAPTAGYAPGSPNPFSFTAHQGRSPTDPSLRRSMTEHRSRRIPPWHPFSGSRAFQGQGTDGTSYPPNPYPQDYSTIPGSFPMDNPPVMTRNMRADSRTAEVGTERHHQSGNNVDRCVQHLKSLGFGDAADQDVSRLRIYAEAANGDLEEAIEMIEEERKVYEQQPSLI